jgi:hypothetical protein
VVYEGFASIRSDFFSVTEAFAFCNVYICLYVNIGASEDGNSSSDRHAQDDADYDNFEDSTEGGLTALDSST